jgi:hypothetical protein
MQTIHRCALFVFFQAAGFAGCTSTWFFSSRTITDTSAFTKAVSIGVSVTVFTVRRS